MKLMRRRAAHIRARSGGFTLMELMVVVMLVAILAMLAAPSFVTARNERLVFDYVRQYQEQIAKARARAMGRGSAHLVLFARGGNHGRGWVRVYEALDATAAPAGPNPVSSCKVAGQWAEATTDPAALPTLNGVRARFIDWMDMNGAGLNDDMDVMSYRGFNRPANQAITSFADTAFVALCFTPGGATYGGSSAADLAGAVSAMQTSSTFNGVFEVMVAKRIGGAATGVRRRVIVAGSSGPRIKSE